MLAESDEKLEEDEKGRSSVTFVRLPVARSTFTLTSHREKEGKQKVAEDFGEGLYLNATWSISHLSTAK
jgi:hypothetical protein